MLAGEARCRAWIDVGDVAARREALAVRRRDAGHLACFDVNAVDRVLEKNRAADAAGDRRSDRFDELKIVVSRIVRASIVATDERNVQQERDVARGQEVIAALAGEERAKPRWHLHLVVEVLESPPQVAEEMPVLVCSR
jgi:phage terminase Nu1 subunit (DNA packaging protein)